jgi:hypothetical protein
MTKKPHTRGVRVLVSVLVLGVVLLPAGCQRTGTVSGKVTYNNKPLKGGTVSFITQTGTPKFTGIADDGSYTVTGVPVGPVKITVDTSAFKTTTGRPQGGGPPAPRSAPGGAKEAPMTPGNPAGAQGQPSSLPGTGPKGDQYTAIPDKYAKADTTPETYTVTPGSQTHDIQIKD